MAFTESETAEHTATIEREFWSRRRPPLAVRDQVREGQRFSGHSIELFFVRPKYLKPKETTEESIAKITYVRSRGVWHVYWKRADLKWHSYKPVTEVGSIALALRIVDRDQYGCFFG